MAAPQGPARPAQHLVRISQTRWCGDSPTVCFRSGRVYSLRGKRRREKTKTKKPNKPWQERACPRTHAHGNRRKFVPPEPEGLGFPASLGTRKRGPGVPQRSPGAGEPPPGPSVWEEASVPLGAPPMGQVRTAASWARARRAHPRLRGDPDPRHVHVAVQQVQLGLERQDQAAGGRKTPGVTRRGAAHQGAGGARGPGGRVWGGAGRRRRRRGRGAGLTAPAARCRCRPCPTPSPSPGPRRSAAAAACAPSP